MRLVDRVRFPLTSFLLTARDEEEWDFRFDTLEHYLWCQTRP